MKGVPRRKVRHSFLLSSFKRKSIDEFYLCRITGFGSGRFVRIAESDAIEQLVAFGEFQSFEVFGSFGRVGDEACGLARQQEPIPIDQAANTIFSPSSPQSIWEQS